MNVIGPIFENLKTLTEKMPPGMLKIYQNLMFIQCNLSKQLSLKESQSKPNKNFVVDTSQFEEDKDRNGWRYWIEW